MFNGGNLNDGLKWQDSLFTCHCLHPWLGRIPVKCPVWSLMCICCDNTIGPDREDTWALMCICCDNTTTLRFRNRRLPLCKFFSIGFDWFTAFSLVENWPGVRLFCSFLRRRLMLLLLLVLTVHQGLSGLLCLPGTPRLVTYSPSRLQGPLPFLYYCKLYNTCLSFLLFFFLLILLWFCCCCFYG